MKHPFTKAVTCLCSAAALAALAVVSSRAETGIGESFKGPIGLQLYSLRADFPKDVAGTLKRVHDFGIKYVELAGTYGLSAEKFRELLDANHLQAVSGHFAFDRLRDDLDGIAKEAKALGLEYVGCAWIPHDGDFDEKECRDAINVFNHAGEVLGKEGFKFFYHTHGYEFQPHGDGTLFDLLMNETKPDLVNYEMDVFWIVHPGQRPAQLLRKYRGRWALMHLKDMKPSTETGLLTGHSDVNNDVALGKGKINFPPILRAAQRVGVKYYFLEDESDQAAKQIPQSLEFLEKVSFDRGNARRQSGN